MDWQARFVLGAWVLYWTMLGLGLGVGHPSKKGKNK